MNEESKRGPAEETLRSVVVDLAVNHTSPDPEATVTHVGALGGTKTTIVATSGAPTSSNDEVVEYGSSFKTTFQENARSIGPDDDVFTNQNPTVVGNKAISRTVQDDIAVEDTLDEGEVRMQGVSTNLIRTLH
mmetsp:Transcript_1595/g.4638  ORF Transcript_1595/g.4638 Transcript_1595/m.4638 type:complete len:133 (-) Transcript_1595:2024-2422(-)